MPVKFTAGEFISESQVKLVIDFAGDGSYSSVVPADGQNALNIQNILCSDDGNAMVFSAWTAQNEHGEQGRYYLWLPKRHTLRPISGRLTRGLCQEISVHMDRNGKSVWIAKKSGNMLFVRQVFFDRAKCTLYDSIPLSAEPTRPTDEMFADAGGRLYLLLGSEWGYFDKGSRSFHQLAAQCPWAYMPDSKTSVFKAKSDGGMRLRLVRAAGGGWFKRTVSCSSSTMQFSPNLEFAFEQDGLIQAALDGSLYVLKSDSLSPIKVPGGAGLLNSGRWLSCAPDGEFGYDLLSTPLSDLTAFESRQKDLQELSFHINASEISPDWLVIGTPSGAFKKTYGCMSANPHSIQDGFAWMLSPADWRASSSPGW